MRRAGGTCLRRHGIGSGWRGGWCGGWCRSKRLGGIIALCAASLGHAATTPARIDRARLVGLSASVLKIEVKRSQGGYSVGSGVVIAPDQVVTNCHVTRDGTEIDVIHAGVRWRVDAQLSDAEHDLCVLRVPRLQGTPVQLGRAADLASGTPLAALGYIAGAGLQASDGVVHSLHRDADGSAARVIQATNSFTSGASGGGLFDAETRLVGILTFRLRGGQVHYFAAPTEWLLPLLADPTRYVPVQPLAGATPAYWQRPADAQPRFLRAAAMEQSLRWAELLNLAGGWADAEPGDAEPWYWLGIALEASAQLAESQRAYEHSLRIDAGWLPALQRLGLLQLQRGQVADARLTESRLREQNPALADALQQALDAHGPPGAADAAPLADACVRAPS